MARAKFAEGQDRYQDVVPSDFFDSQWRLGNPRPGDGVHALMHLDDLATVVVPDLYSPAPLQPVENIMDEPPRVGAQFEPCLPASPSIDEQSPAHQDLAGLSLDPNLPSDLNQIVQLQRQLVDLAEQQRRFVVLLDVPPNLTHRQQLRWRGNFRSSFAAAYHPWLRASRTDDARANTVEVNPSAYAAGMIAAQELAFGVSHGPANQLAAGVIAVEDTVTPDSRSILHPEGINVYLREPDGVRLTAARTLSGDPRFRQLSVRRLLIMLHRVLKRQMQWMVFEPNTPALWSEVRFVITNYLRQLFRAGAFRGANETEAFFVKCDEHLNPDYVRERGQLIVHIGIAPTEPLEFIVLKISRTPDGALVVEE